MAREQQQLEALEAHGEGLAAAILEARQRLTELLTRQAGVQRELTRKRALRDGSPEWVTIQKEVTL